MTILTEKLLSTESGFILFIGIMLGIVLGSIVTFMINQGMHKDRDE